VKKNDKSNNSWTTGISSKGKKRPPPSDEEDEYVPKSERRNQTKKSKKKRVLRMTCKLIFLLSVGGAWFVVFRGSCWVQTHRWVDILNP